MKILYFFPFDLYDLNGGGGANEVFKSAWKTVLSFYRKWKYTWFFFKSGVEILLTDCIGTGMEKWSVFKFWESKPNILWLYFIHHCTSLQIQMCYLEISGFMFCKYRIVTSKYEWLLYSFLPVALLESCRTAAAWMTWDDRGLLSVPGIAEPGCPGCPDPHSSQSLHPARPAWGRPDSVVLLLSWRGPW